MAGPTSEVLNEDLKALREDLHKVETAIMGEVNSVSKGLAELKTEVHVSLGVAKWVVTAVVGVVLGGGITSAVAAVWWASGINTQVRLLAESSARVVKVVETSHRVEAPAPKPDPGNDNSVVPLPEPSARPRAN